MTISQGEHYSAKRDLWLCLARAFAPPKSDLEFYSAFVEDLPQDLSAIAEEIGLNIGEEVESLRKAVRNIKDALEIQRIYSALFVTPPVPVFMNTAIYMDGAFLGPTELDIQSWYAKHGFERHAEFRDLNDHAAVQFEFVGLLCQKAADRAFANDDVEAVAFATEAERFLNAFPRRWITAFLSGLENICSEHELNDTYVHLARIAWLAIENSLATGTARHEFAVEVSFPQGSSFGLGKLTAEDLAEIAIRLECAGLSYAHVKDLPEWRDDVFTRRKAQPNNDVSVVAGHA
jgi:TorA maturation chaperone TorD